MTNDAKPCPSCGYCPTCGRRGYYPMPYWVNPYWPGSRPLWPWWQVNPWPVGGPITANVTAASGTITNVAIPAGTTYLGAPPSEPSS